VDFAGVTTEVAWKKKANKWEFAVGITDVNLEPLCLLYQIEAGPTHKFRQNFEFVLFLTQILGSVSPPYHFQLIWAVIKPGMRLEMARPEEISGHGNQHDAAGNLFPCRLGEGFLAMTSAGRS